MKSQALGFLFLSRAACVNAWRGLLKGAGDSIPVGFVVPCGIASAVLLSLLVHRVFLVHLTSSEAFEPEAEVASWILLLGVFSCFCSGILAVSGAVQPLPPRRLALAPLGKPLLAAAWCAPLVLAALALALLVSVPTALAFAEWLDAGVSVAVRLVLTTTAVLVVAGLAGHAICGSLEVGLQRSALRSVRGLPQVIAAVPLGAACLLATWALRSADLAPWLGSMGRQLTTPALATTPSGWTGGILIGLGVGVAPLFVRERRSDALPRTHAPSEWRSSGATSASIARLDLLLWSRDRQGLALAVILQVFWVLMSLFCVAESALQSSHVGQPVDAAQFQGVMRYLMPIGWAFFSTLSIGLTFDGGRQIMSAPIDVAEIVWGKFIASLVFCGVQWLLCSLCTGLVFGTSGIPPGASVILALFVLACACSFLAGILIPVDKRRIRSGFGAFPTSVLAAFTYLVGLAVVFVPTHAWIAGIRLRSVVQVLICFVLVGLLVAAAGKAAKTYGLTR